MSALLRSLLCGALLVPGALASDGGQADGSFVLGKPYPLAIEIDRHVALFHWLDSLVGTSGGKTIPAHRRQYMHHFGEVTSTEQDALQRFREARTRDWAQPKRVMLPGTSPRLSGSVWLRSVFMDADTLEAALQRARSGMRDPEFQMLQESLLYFDRKYDRIWQDGAVPRRFVERFRRDPARKRLQRLLARIADALGVDPAKIPRPVVFLVPVPTGHGTHATAVGPYLLLEVRPPDRLAQQASVIVHENAHYLFYSMHEQRRQRFESIVGDLPPYAAKAWRALHEALPTALGQGVADSRFRSWSWSTKAPWYHTAEIDAYAKAIFPLVRETLKQGRPFDEHFLIEVLALYPERFRDGSGSAGARSSAEPSGQPFEVLAQERMSPR